MQTKYVALALVALAVGASAAVAKDCTPLGDYFSPLGSFTIFKSMLERTAKLTNDEVPFGLDAEDPDHVTMLVPNDLVIADLLNDLGMDIHDWLTMDQNELAKITRSHATLGDKSFNKGYEYLTFNMPTTLSVVENDGDSAVVYNGLVTAMVNLTMKMTDICDVTWYLVDQPLLPATEYVMDLAGR